jgi:hypothetical protein
MPKPIVKPGEESVSFKLGANRHDAARKLRKRDPNFRQSRDVHEDRSMRQIKGRQGITH